MDVAETRQSMLDGWQTWLTTSMRQTVSRYREIGSLPDAWRLLAAAACSYIGSELNAIALIALSFHLGGGAMGVGGMLIAGSIPRLLAQGPAGALVDRYPGPRLLVATQLLLALIAAGFIALTVMPSVWLLYALIVASGVVGTVDIPAFELRLMNVVPTEQRGTANALHVLAMSSSGLVGPLIGGVLLGVFGSVPLFLLNSVSFLVVACTVGMMRSPAPPDAGPGESAPRPGIPRSGYREILKRPAVALYTVLITCSSIFGVASVTLLIVRSHELGLGDAGVGMLFMVSALGALVGGILAGGGTYDSPRAYVISGTAAAVWILAIALFGLANTLVVALPALLLGSLMGQIEEIAGLTAFQNQLPESVYGRVFSLFLIAGAAGSIIGGVAGPALAATLGTGQSLAVLGLPGLLLSIVFIFKIGELGWFAGVPRVPALEPEVMGHLMPGPRPDRRRVLVAQPVRRLPVPRVYRPV